MTQSYVTPGHWCLDVSVIPNVFLHLDIHIHMPNVLQFIWIEKLLLIINRRMQIHLPEKKFNILALITPHIQLPISSVRVWPVRLHINSNLGFQIR